MAKKDKFEMPDPMFDKLFWQHFGMETYTEYKKHTFDVGNPKMSDGQDFPKYSSGYKKARK